MNNIQINNLFKNDNLYLGTFPKDLLPYSKQQEFRLIINTDNSNQPGEHWVAINKIKNKVEYFDSFGLPPLHKEIIEFLNHYSSERWSYNTITFQSEKSDACGMYCVMFLELRKRGYKAEQIETLFSHKTALKDIVAKTLYKVMWSCLWN